MTISRREAKPLCTKREYELVETSFERGTAGLTPARVRGYVSRARKLRDKYRGLSERQRREARGKQAPRGVRPSQSNDRTVLKQRLFEQTMQRFEKKLDRVEAAADKQAAYHAENTKPEKAGARSTARTPEPAPQPTGGRRRTAEEVLAEKRRMSAAAGRKGKQAPNPAATLVNDPVRPRATRRRMKSFVAKLPRKQSQIAESARSHIIGHVATLTRQNQARRDARN